MKINSILSRLEEKFHSSKNSQFGGYVEIFKNPTLDEIKVSLRKADPNFGEKNSHLRFLAIKDREEVYVWNPLVTHVEVEKDVKMKFREMKDYNIAGMAELINNRLVPNFKMMDSVISRRKSEIVVEIKNGEWDWLEKYHFDLSELERDSLYQ